MRRHLRYALLRLRAEFNLPRVRLADLFARKGRQPVVLINYATRAISIRRGSSTIAEQASAIGHTAAPLERAANMFCRQTADGTIRFLASTNGYIWRAYVYSVTNIEYVGR